MTDEINKTNKNIEQGDIVITNEEIIAKQKEKARHVDAFTAPTMSTLFANASKKFMEEKKKRESMNPKE